MRVQTVEKSRKSPGACGKCHKEIAAGEPYRWTKGRYTSKAVRCMAETCAFRASDLTGSKMAAAYAAQEDAEDALAAWSPEDDSDGSGLVSDLETAAEAIRGVGEEYQASADSIRDSFSESSTADECEEKANGLEDWAGEIENAAQEIEAFDEEDVDFDAEGVEREDPERPEGESDEDYKKRCDDVHSTRVEEAREEAVRAAREEWAEEIRSNVEAALGACPV